jgi:hypothetical protein
MSIKLRRKNCLNIAVVSISITLICWATVMLLAWDASKSLPFDEAVIWAFLIGLGGATCWNFLWFISPKSWQSQKEASDES